MDIPLISDLKNYFWYCIKLYSDFIQIFNEWNEQLCESCHLLQKIYWLQISLQNFIYKLKWVHELQTYIYNEILRKEENSN